MPDLVDLIGYLASALIVLSLLMASVLRLRVINLVGAIVFTLYGVLIDSVPVVLTNGAIVVINVYYLWRMWRDRAAASYFEVVEWPKDGVYLPRFLAFHADDIRASQPEFSGVRDDHTAVVVLRDAVPVGVVLLRDPGDGTATVDLDYVTPAHRDFHPATHVFGPEGPFAARGITRVAATATTPLHRRYLRRLGFERAGDAWVRHLP